MKKRIKISMAWLSLGKERMFGLSDKMTAEILGGAIAVPDTNRECPAQKPPPTPPPPIQDATSHGLTPCCCR